MSNQKTEAHQAPRREPMSPDEVMAAARKRVEKLEAALLALGEGDDMFRVLQEALKKARAQEQERPVSERIHATKLFLERKQKRVEAARQSTMKAREELVACLAAQEKEEALLADGEQRWKRTTLLLPGVHHFRQLSPTPRLSCCECRQDLQAKDDDSMGVVAVSETLTASAKMLGLIDEASSKRPRVAVGVGASASKVGSTSAVQE